MHLQSDNILLNICLDQIESDTHFLDNADDLLLASRSRFFFEQTIRYETQKRFIDYTSVLKWIECSSD